VCARRAQEFTLGVAGPVAILLALLRRSLEPAAAAAARAVAAAGGAEAAAAGTAEQAAAAAAAAAAEADSMAAADAVAAAAAAAAAAGGGGGTGPVPPVGTACAAMHALLNLSATAEHQTAIVTLGLDTILRCATVDGRLMLGRSEDTAGAEGEGEEAAAAQWEDYLLSRLQEFAAGVLSNCQYHPANRTAFYKRELASKVRWCGGGGCAPSLARSRTSLTCLLARSLTCSLAHLLAGLLARSLTCSLANLLARLLTRSLTRSLARHSLTHSLARARARFRKGPLLTAADLAL
jgi:hypothetical protein